jgi:hypothetical protein
METKRCYNCGTTKPVSDFYSDAWAWDGYFSMCKSCSSDYHKTDAAKARRRRRWWLDRMAALQAYGGTPPRCVCCNETEVTFLVIDHIGGGGGEQRRLIGKNRVNAWLRLNDYPPGYRVLCHNCNFAEHNGGCPHKHGKESS